MRVWGLKVPRKPLKETHVHSDTDKTNVITLTTNARAKIWSIAFHFHLEKLSFIIREKHLL